MFLNVFLFGIQIILLSFSIVKSERGNSKSGKERNKKREEKKKNEKNRSSKVSQKERAPNELQETGLQAQASGIFEVILVLPSAIVIRKKHSSFRFCLRPREKPPSTIPIYVFPKSSVFSNTFCCKTICKQKAKRHQTWTKGIVY